MSIYKRLIESLSSISNKAGTACFDLFGGCDGKEYAYDADSGRWITVHPNGAEEGKGRKIHLDENGHIDSNGPLADALKEKEYTHKDTGVRKSISNIYTGTAADYHKPSIVHVGTGEGCQAYGWGLYGSNQRGVGEVYSHGKYKGVFYNGNKIEENFNSPENIAAKAYSESDGTLSGVKKKVEDYLIEDKIDFAAEDAAKKFLDRHFEQMEVKRSPSYLYSQTFFTNRAPGDESHLLNWYEPVSRENWQRIMSAIKKTDGWKEKLDSTFARGWQNKSSYADAEEVYKYFLPKVINELYGKVGTPKGVSEFLATADIDGIKYPVDSYGKTVKDGDKAGWNYVSFRDDNINVDKKWVDGKEVPVANNANQTAAMVSILKDFVPGIEVGVVEPEDVEEKIGESYDITDIKDITDGVRNLHGDVLPHDQSDVSSIGKSDDIISHGMSSRQEGVRKSLIIGEVGASTLAQNENVQALQNLKVAKEMLGDGDWEKMSREEKLKVKNATGWEKGKDGKWRRESFDIPDRDFEAILGKRTETYEKMKDEWRKKSSFYDHILLDPNASEQQIAIAKEDVDNAKNNLTGFYGVNSYIPSTLKAVIGENHEVIKAYPELADIDIHLIQSDGFLDRGRVSYENGRPSIEIASGVLLDQKQFKNTLTHEIQHVIQKKEGFGQGGNLNLGHIIENAEEEDWQNEQRRISAAEYSDRQELNQVIVDAGKKDELDFILKDSMARGLKRGEYLKRKNALLDSIPGYRDKEKEIEDRIAKREAEFAPKTEARKRRANMRYGDIQLPGTIGYRRISGEVEARNAGARTESDRSTIGKELLEDTEDIAREDQVVVQDAKKAIEQDIAFTKAGTSKHPIRNRHGQVAGWYDRNTGSVRLVKGVASPATVAHEIGWHATFHWAEKNHPELYNKLVQYAKDAPEGIETSIKEKYGTKLTPHELLDEIGAERFTREDISSLLSEAQKRASTQFFDKVENEQDNLRKAFVGANRALSKSELDEIATLPPKEAVKALVQKMLEGRTLGGRNPNGDGNNGGGGKRKSVGDATCCDLFAVSDEIPCENLNTDGLFPKNTHATPTQDSAYQPKKIYFRELIKSLKGISEEKEGEITRPHRPPTPPALGEMTRARVSERMPKNPDRINSAMKPSEVKEMIKGSCSLIKTVPHGKKTRGIETRVKRLFEDTNTTKDTFRRYLEKKCNLKPYQANRIIEDQICKYKAKTQLEELRRQGVKLVRWCVGDCKEHRPSHLAHWPNGLNGCVFEIDNPPTDPATGEKIYPGDEIQCHCYLEAVE